MFSGAEYLHPARPRPKDRIKAVTDNLLLSVISSIILRALPTILASQAALSAQINNWGLSYAIRLTDSPILLLILSILILDLAIYWQHRLFHAYPLLWRLHRVHHSDAHVDASTALRFHPLEIVISMALKSALVLTFGIPVIAVVMFEILLNASAIFNHSNISLPKSVEKLLRKVIITPELHRIHHSQLRKECDSNFGFFLSIWDQVFATYTAPEQVRKATLKIGVRDMLPEKGVRKLLAQPFKH